MSINNAVNGQVMVASATGTGVSGTITLSGLPQNFKDLIVVAYLRSDRAAFNVDTLAVRFNNDIGTNYTFDYSGVNNGVAAQGQTLNASTAWDGGTPAAGSTANRMTVIQMRIVDYTNTGGFHYALMDVTQENSENLQYYHSVCRYQSTVAVSRVDFILTNGNFISASTVRVYGVQ